MPPSFLAVLFVLAILSAQAIYYTTLLLDHHRVELLLSDWRLGIHRYVASRCQQWSNLGGLPITPILHTDPALQSMLPVSFHNYGLRWSYTPVTRRTTVNDLGDPDGPIASERVQTLLAESTRATRSGSAIEFSHLEHAAATATPPLSLMNIHALHYRPGTAAQVAVVPGLLTPLITPQQVTPGTLADIPSFANLPDTCL